MRILFVSNGNGEVAIAERIAVAVHALAPDAQLDHLALVGAPKSSERLTVVGPNRAMPSGGLLAMFNLRNICADLGNGLIGLTLRQLQFLRRSRDRYDVVLAIGDIFALFMAQRVRAATIFIGTAKSISVARYGGGELRLMRSATYCFVRDEPTAEDCRVRGLRTVDAANAIVDLHDTDRIANIILPNATQLVLLFPGSRVGAYEEARMLCSVLTHVRERGIEVIGALAVAPRLDRAQFVAILSSDGWRYEERGEYGAPWLIRGDLCVLLWDSQIGGLLPHTALVLGQAGTANEAAAAAGIPVAAIDDGSTRAERWYRMRQQALLGDGMLLLPRDPVAAGAQLADLLEDRSRRLRMGAIGRRRMGEPGGALRIAQRTILCAVQA